MSGRNEKLTKLLRLAVGSDSEGEQLTALRRMLRMLTEDGKTAADLQVFTLTVEAVRESPTTHFGKPPRSEVEPETDWEPPWRKFARYGQGQRPTAEAQTAAAAAAQEALLQAQLDQLKQRKQDQERPTHNPFAAEPATVEVEAEPVLSEYAEYDLARIPRHFYDYVHEIRVPFGKHAGMTPLGIVVKDKKYATWAVENFKDDRWVKLFRAALIRRKHHPLEHVDTSNE